MTSSEVWAQRIEQVGREAPMGQATLKQSTQDLIRQLLFSGAMVPGEIYSANSLAAHLGISNSPAREAMMALSSQGLLEPVRNRGFRVVELSAHDRHEVYELRVLIEVEAVRRAALRDLSEEELDRIIGLAEHSVEVLPAMPEDPALPYLNADHDFHMGLVDLMRNSRWSTIVSGLRDESRVNGAYRHLENNQGLHHSAQEHLDIAHAVRDGDAERAAQLMIKHLEYSRPHDCPTSF